VQRRSRRLLQAAHQRVPAIGVLTLVVLSASGCAAGGPFSAPLSNFAPSTAPSATPTQVAPETPRPVKPESYDYRKMLVQPEDLARSNSGYAMPQPATLNPDGIPGAEVMLTSNDSTNAIGTTIVVLANETSAPIELPKAVAHLSTVKSTDSPHPIAVGDEAFVISGSTPDGTQAATALIYRYRNALVRIDFYSLPAQPTPTETVIDVGRLQTALLRVGLDAAATP
jgi:hypothetical protein